MCVVYMQSTDPADKDAWKDKGTGQLSIKCKEGISKGTKESKPTILIRNDVRFIMLNLYSLIILLVYPSSLFPKSFLTTVVVGLFFYFSLYISYNVLYILLIGGETASECFNLSRDQNKYSKEFHCCNIPYFGNVYLHTNYQHICITWSEITCARKFPKTSVANILFCFL